MCPGVIRAFVVMSFVALERITVGPLGTVVLYSVLCFCVLNALHWTRDCSVTSILDGKYTRSCEKRNDTLCIILNHVQVVV